MRVPANPTVHAAMRCRPTASLRNMWPKSNIMNGITKAMATASARGRYFRARNIANSPAMCRAVRTSVSRNARRPIRNEPPVAKTTGSKITGCIAKRTVTNTITGMLAVSALARPSPRGAKTQKPSMRVIPRIGRSVATWPVMSGRPPNRPPAFR